MQDLVIVGAGGLGREVALLVERINEKTKRWNLIGFVDDNPTLHNQFFNGIPVIGNIDWLRYQRYNIICAIADTGTREKIILILAGTQNEFVTLIHPQVDINRFTEIGEGCIICQGCIISTNVKIGNHVIIDWNATIGHDTLISDFTTLYPASNISGNVQIGIGATFGTGSQVLPSLRIGDHTVVGAGSVVTKHLSNNIIVIGIPAKEMKK
jgi:sugar O-acyltransferase (sialic acid O-acetyltransferase NeuD family)